MADRGGSNRTLEATFCGRVETTLSALYVPLLVWTSTEPCRSVTLETIVSNDQQRRSVRRASSKISTLPQNVASKVRFDPPLSALRQEAFSIKHVGQGDRNSSVAERVVAESRRELVWRVVRLVPGVPDARAVRFDPPLSALRQEAFSIKHVGQGHKIHSIFNRP
jgi:hypothetical protein